MSTGTSLRSCRRPAGSRLAALGAQLAFYASAVRWLPRALGAHRRETLRHVGAIGAGAAGVAVVGGVALVTAVLACVPALGAGPIDPAAVSGVLTGYAGTREIAPLVAAVALSATLGCRYTAELGAARASQEAESIEAMGLRALPYLVSTRLLAGVAAVAPLYGLALLCGYAVARTVAAAITGGSPGGHDRYVQLVLAPQDVALSLVKTLIFGVIVVLVHCYHGYCAGGGHAEVGRAVARAVRGVTIAVACADVCFTLAVWGASSSVRIAG